jgi:hypothetical protein
VIVERARYDAQLASSMDQSTRAAIWSAIDEILDHGPLGSNYNDAQTGLALGYVQSGKTISIIGLISSAVDRGYRLVISLLGSTNLLVDQNTHRIRRAMLDERRDYKWVELSGLKGTSGSNDVSTWLGRDRTIFVPVIKHAGRIRDLANVLKRVPLDDVPTLVIDDEADQASLNTSVKQSAESSTYAALSVLRGQLPQHLYVQYTATPYAPLLLDLGDHLLPEFVTLLHPGPGYTGGREFFVDHQDKVIRSIPSSDEQPAKTLPGRLQGSLVAALANFLLGAGALLARDEELEPISMLVHSTQRNDVQGRYHFLIQRQIRKWSLEVDGAAHVGELPEVFKTELSSLTRAGAIMPAEDDLLPHLRRAIREATCWLVNSESAVRSVQWNIAPVHILVGGNKLDRGFTVEGLTVTYMNRPPSPQIDTLEQRARAFGYRNELLPYCQFFATPRTLKILRDMVYTEYDLRARLRDVLDGGGTVDDWAREVGLLLPAGTKPTRPSVIGVLNRFNNSADGWHAMRRPSLDAVEVKANEALVSATGILDAERVSFGRLSFRTLRMPSELLVELLLEPWALQSYSPGWRHNDIIEHLKRAADGRDVRIVLMDNQTGGARVRAWDELGFVNLFQGRDTREQDAGFYPGDRAVPGEVDGALVAVQIHYVQPRHQPHTKVHTLAIRMGEMQTVRRPPSDG